MCRSKNMYSQYIDIIFSILSVRFGRHSYHFFFPQSKPVFKHKSYFHITYLKFKKKKEKRNGVRWAS